MRRTSCISWVDGWPDCVTGVAATTPVGTLQPCRLNAPDDGVDGRTSGERRTRVDLPGDASGGAPGTGDEVGVLGGDQVAHHPHDHGHQVRGPDAGTSQRGDGLRHGEQPGEAAGGGEREPVVLHQDITPPVRVVVGAEEFDGEPRGLEGVVDALAVERVDACRGVADQHPVPAGDAGHRTAHRQQGRGDADGRAVECPLVVHHRGIVLEDRPKGHVRRPLRRGERADADVDLAAAGRAEWEDPAVPGQQSAVGSAELEVRPHPVRIGARGGCVCACGHTVGGVSMPLPPKRFADSRPDPVGDDEVGHPHRVRARGGREGHRAHPVAVHFDVNSLDALHHSRSDRHRVGADGLVELGSCHRAPVRRETAGRPPDLLAGTPTVEQESVDARTVGEQRAQPERVEFGDGARRESVTTRLVAREHRGVGEDHVPAGGDGMGGRRGSTRSGADDEDVGGIGEKRGRVRAHPTSMSGPPTG
ncbi:hypothetical protein KTR9_0965 [Gordonia sp. KTR9]|nr:hypothetical protein KTR9_0965 [Gordonia sp. KTR9]